MINWEEDPDAWKESEDVKPWEGADAWKLADDYKPGETEASRDPRVERRLEVTVGLRPEVVTMKVDNTPDVSVKDRDALKLIAVVSSGQKATTDEGELFQFSSSRYMWVKIPWEIC